MRKPKEGIVLSLLLIAFLVPLAVYRGTHNYILIKLSLTQTLVLLSLLLWIGKGLCSGKNLELTGTSLDRPVVLFFFLSLLSLVVSAYRRTGTPEIYRLATYLLLYGFTVNIVRERQSSSRIVSAWLLSTGLVSFYGLYQHFFREITPPRSTFGNANFFAAYLVLVFPLTLTLFIRSIFCELRKNWLRILLLGILLPMMVLSLFLTSSRGAWLGLGIGLISLVWLGCLRVSLRWIATRLIPVFLTFILILSAFLAPRLLEKGFVKEELEKGTLGLRILIWEGTARMIAAHPFLGSGTGSFQVAYPQYRIPEYFGNPHAVDSTAHAHNEFLEIAAETGILGLGAFLWILVVFFRKGTDIVRREDNGYKRGLAMGLVSGVAGLLATNLFGVNLRFPSSAIFLWLAMGLVMGRAPVTSYRLPVAKLSPLLRKVIFAFVLLLALEAGWLVVAKPFLADRYFQRGINYRKEGAWEKAISEYRKAVELVPYFADIYYRLGFAYAAAGETDRAIETYKRLLFIVPYYARTQANLGMLYLKESHPERALWYLEEAERLNPYDPAVLINLALIAMEKGEKDRAAGYLRRILSVDPDYKPARYLLRKMTGQ